MARRAPPPRSASQLSAYDDAGAGDAWYHAHADALVTAAPVRQEDRNGDGRRREDAAARDQQVRPQLLALAFVQAILGGVRFVLVDARERVEPGPDRDAC